MVVLGSFMSILDATIMNVALATLRRELHSPLHTIQWVATGYLVALAVVMEQTMTRLVCRGLRPRPRRADASAH